MPRTGFLPMLMYRMAARGGRTIMAVSEAMLPHTAMNVKTKTARLAGTFFRLECSSALIRPEFSQMPMPIPSTTTRPKGAKSVKLVSILASSHWTPSFENRLLTTTVSPVAGLTLLTPHHAKMALSTATNTNSQTNKMAGGGSLLQARSTASRQRSTRGFFISLMVLSFSMVYAPHPFSLLNCSLGNLYYIPFSLLLP